jgi:hypothetical protein
VLFESVKVWTVFEIVWIFWNGLNWIQSRLTVSIDTMPPGPTGQPHCSSHASMRCLALPTAASTCHSRAAAALPPARPYSFLLHGHMKPAPTTAPCRRAALKRVERRCRLLFPLHTVSLSAQPCAKAPTSPRWPPVHFGHWRAVDTSEIRATATVLPHPSVSSTCTTVSSSLDRASPPPSFSGAVGPSHHHRHPTELPPSENATAAEGNRRLPDISSPRWVSASTRLLDMFPLAARCSSH